MRGTIIIIWGVLLLTTGYTLFHITFEVEALEAELVRLNAEIRKEQENTHVLKAEWSYLSSPQRLEALGTTLLPDLTRMSPDQVVSVEEIPFPYPEPDPELGPDFDPPTLGASTGPRIDPTPAQATTISVSGDKE